MAIKRDPVNVAAYENRAAQYTTLGEREKAFVDYCRAIALKPNDPKLYAKRATLGCDFEYHLDQALADYTKAIQLSPKDATLFAGRAALYSRLHQPKDLIEDCSRALALDPSNADFLESRCRAYMTLEDYKNAAIDAKEAIRLDPKDGSHYLRLGECDAQLGLDKESRENTKKGWALCSDRPGSLSNVYQDEMKERLERNWVPPITQGETSPKIEFVVTSDGSIRCLKFLEWSKVEAENRSLVQAVQKSAPFPPLPAGVGDCLFQMVPGFQGSSYMRKMDVWVERNYAAPPNTKGRKTIVQCHVEKAGNA